MRVDAVREPEPKVCASGVCVLFATARLVWDPRLEDSDVPAARRIHERPVTGRQQCIGGQSVFRIGHCQTTRGESDSEISSSLDVCHGVLLRHPGHIGKATRRRLLIPTWHRQ